MAEALYCNTTTDLQSLEPNIDSYDSKRIITGWVSAGTGDANDYKLHNSGYISLLYRDGEDLGAADSNIDAVEDDKHWYYDSDGDWVILHDTGTVTDRVYEASQDWADYKTRVVQEASEFVRSYVARPILVRKDSASSRDYDMIIIRSTAYLACAMLIQSYDFEKARELEWRAINPEDGSGLLDRLKAGDFVLWNEVSESKRQGNVTIVTQGGSSTGDIIDVRGKATIAWDLIRVKIITGGTVTKGSASSVTYSTWVGDSTGIQTSQLYDAATVTGNYTNIGHGIQIRMSDGVYTADDAWDVEVSGSTFDNPKIKRINLTRN